MTNDSMNFFEEFERLLTAEKFQRFAIILMSGDRYDVSYNDQLLPLKTMYNYYPSDGGT